MLLEVILAPGALQSAGLEGRDEIEDPLDDALREAGLGEVTGGGGGIRGSNIDIEIDNEDCVHEALSVIRRVLLPLGLPASTLVRRSEPSPTVYWLYDAN